ncbi:MAG: formate--tetrahydrofolate ligase, partial [Gammaproteobacteria bacterium]
DIEIAQKANKERILDLAQKQYDIAAEHLEPYGHYKAKLSLDYIDSLRDRPDGKLILTTAISPTPAGEGKTTTTVGLGDAMNRIGKQTLICLREPSLGPCFGIKGGAAGGGFDITVASEVMAIFCLATSIKDLKERLGNIVVGYTRGDRKPVMARDLKAHGAMAALLKDAIMPNLVQTLENNLAFVHGGPFANIAHGCNSVTATKTALKLSDYVITEAGFGADLGAEKFIDIKCRMAGLKPAAVVLVATVRAMKYHGGVNKEELSKENLEALEKGLVNLERHYNNIRNHFGLPCIVSINHFTHDTDAEIELLKKKVESLGGKAVVARHWAEGGAGAEELARTVVDVVDNHPGSHTFVYDEKAPLWDKIEAIAKKIYGAGAVTAPAKVKQQLEAWDKDYGRFPVCMAKTQMSFTTDPTVRGAPEGHTVEISEVRLSNGAGFVVAIAGNMMTMPGLPKSPAAEKIDVDDKGNISGLF